MADISTYDLVVQLKMATADFSAALNNVTVQAEKVMKEVSRPIEIQVDTKAYNETISDVKGVAREAYDAISQKQEETFLKFGKKARLIAATNAALDNFVTITRDATYQSEKLAEAETQYELTKIRKKKILSELADLMDKGSITDKKQAELVERLNIEQKELIKGKRIISLLEDAERKVVKDYIKDYSHLFKWQAKIAEKFDAFKSSSKDYAKTGGLAKSFRMMAHAIKPLVTLFKSLNIVLLPLKLLGNVVEIWDEFKDTQDRFASVTFRAAGTIESLVGSTNLLRRELGLTLEQSASSIESLANAAIYSEQTIDDTLVSFDDFIKANAQISVATGVSTDIVAAFQKQLAVANVSMDESTAVLGHIADAASKAGLSVEELSGLIATLTDAAVVLRMRFGEDTITPYIKQMTTLTAFAKREGAVVSDAVKNLFAAAIEDPLQFVVLLREKAFAEDPIDMLKSMIMHADEMREAYENTPPAIRKIWEELHNVNVQSLSGLQAMAVAYKEFHEETGKSYEEWVKHVAELNQRNLTTSFEDAMNTLKRTFQRIAAPFFTIFSDILNKLAPYLQKILQSLYPIIKEFMNEWDDVLQYITVMFRNVFGIFQGMKEPLKALMELGTSILRIFIAMGLAFVQGLGNSNKTASETNASFMDMASAIRDVTAEIMKYGKDLVNLAFTFGKNLVPIITDFVIPGLINVAKGFIMIVRVGVPALITIAKILGEIAGLLATITGGVGIGAGLGFLLGGPAGAAIGGGIGAIGEWLFGDDDTEVAANKLTSAFNDASSEANKFEESIAGMLSSLDVADELMGQLTKNTKEFGNALNGTANAENELGRAIDERVDKMTESAYRAAAQSLGVALEPTESERQIAEAERQHDRYWNVLTALEREKLTAWQVRSRQARTAGLPIRGPSDEIQSILNKLKDNTENQQNGPSADQVEETNERLREQSGYHRDMLNELKEQGRYRPQRSRNRYHNRWR